MIQVVCRDGVTARIQRVPYQGLMECDVFFGKRFHPTVPLFDKDGQSNESGDLWTLDGFWNMFGCPHPFDIVKGLDLHQSPIGIHAHA